MKKILYAITILTFVFAMVGCSKDDEFVIPTPPDTPDTPEDYDNLRDSIGTATRPTDWTGPITTDPTSVQTITITSAELPTVVEDEDMLAAFCGNVCRAVTTPVHESNGKTAFTLVVMAMIDEATTAPIDLELRYYSLHNKRIYTSNKIRFRPGVTLGSLNNGGYKAEWK